jgi:hypothetical protein
VTLFDGTTKVLAEESCVSFNNAVWAYADQGLSSISDSGVAVVSRPIEFDIIRLSTSQYTNFPSASFGVSYESDRKYIFSTVTNVGDTYATQQYVYNTATQTFTRWLLNWKCALVTEYDGKLYYGNATNNTVYQERKNFNQTDYAMEELATSISVVAGTTLTVPNTTGFAAGDTIAQLSGTTVVRESVIQSVPDSTHVVVADTLLWALTSATVYKPISVEIEYTPIHGGNPGIVKLFEDLVMFFANANFDKITLTFVSDQDIGPETFDVTPSLTGGWGLFPWGQIAWGIHTGELQPIRTLVPSAKARCHWYSLKITQSQALANFSLVGITSFFDEISEIMK